MMIDNALDFIDNYSKFYFDDVCCNDDRGKYGLPKCLQTTNRKVEKWICEQYLEKKAFDEWALAWKFGRLEGVKYAPMFVQGECYCDNYGNKVRIPEFQDYCKSLNSIDFKSQDLEFLYRSLSDIAPTNIGPVYILTTMFFMTGGRIPIYDRFAHRAVRALLIDGIPNSDNVKRSIRSMSDKSCVNGVMNIYKDYIESLRIVFPNEVRRTGTVEPFITRALDQALWVYGHANSRWIH